jgi:hypothetical protein
MYIIGGYAYTPEEMRDLLLKRGATLPGRGIAWQATRFFHEQGFPYDILSCQHEDQHLFMFVAAFKAIDDELTTYEPLEETEAARAMKAELKLEVPFTTALY